MLAELSVSESEKKTLRERTPMTESMLNSIHQLSEKGGKMRFYTNSKNNHLFSMKKFEV